MTTPIILAAFGSSKAAQEHYIQFKNKVQKAFPEYPVYSTITSRTVASRSTAPFPHPAELLDQLAGRGVTEAVVQSLHLLPSHDFHSFIKTIRQSTINTIIGMPLLTSEDDFRLSAHGILSFKKPDPSTAILVLAHGTSHPCWAMYANFEKEIKTILGEQGFFGVIEKSPDSSHIPQLIKDKGFSSVLIVPFFFLLGLHFKRDIMGDDTSSWRNQLQALDLSVTSIEYGVGELESIQQIFIHHIRNSLDKL